MSYFHGELKIGYHIHHVDPGPVDVAVRKALAGAFRAEFRVGKNAENCYFYDKWDHLTIDVTDTASLMTWITTALRDASGNNNFDVIADAAYHDQYTHYDDRTICEHAFKIRVSGSAYQEQVTVSGVTHTVSQVFAVARFDPCHPAPTPA